MPLIYAYPDCPTCDKQVDVVEHESINDRREFSTDYTIHGKGNPFVLRPCGHEMRGLVLQFDPVIKITEWQVRSWPPLPFPDPAEVKS
jgi:hypothetical protein